MTLLSGGAITHNAASATIHTTSSGRQWRETKWPRLSKNLIACRFSAGTPALSSSAAGHVAQNPLASNAAVGRSARDSPVFLDANVRSQIAGRRAAEKPEVQRPLGSRTGFGQRPD